MATEFPVGDDQFEEAVIDRVEAHSDGGWTICHDKGVCFGGVPADTPVEPKIGMTARFYGGAGAGSRVRGLFLDGQRVFYRTKTEDEEVAEIELYGADAADWLARWDSGHSVWSIEMGGLGPGYEQAIQATAAEILRHLLSEKYDHAVWSDTDAWKRDRTKIETYGFANKRIKTLGLSGAQWGAALSLATKLYMEGPRSIMNNEQVKDRHIQVSRTFPAEAALKS